MSNIKIGIVGSGRMARHHLERFSPIETAEVVAIASRNEKTGNQLAAKWSATFISDWRHLVELQLPKPKGIGIV